MPVTIPARTIALFVGIALVGFVLLAGLYATRSILLELVAAIVLAMAAEPVVQVFERRGLRRGAAVGISFGLLLAALIVLGYFLLSPLVDQTTRLVHNGPQIVDDLRTGHGELGFLETRFHIVERAKEIDAGTLGATSGPARGAVDSVVRTAGSIVFVLFLTLFVQLGGRQWFESLVGFVPERNRKRVRRAGEGISTAVGGYVSGNLLISFVAGSVTAVILTATSVPYPIALGLIVAIFDLVPMVGATIGTIIVAVVALSTEGIVTAAIVVAAMIVYQQIENNVLQQLVYHRTVKLSPLAIALSVAVGAQLAGVVGALLGIPFAGAVKVVSNELIAWRRGDGPAADRLATFRAADQRFRRFAAGRPAQGSIHVVYPGSGALGMAAVSQKNDLVSRLKIEPNPALLEHARKRAESVQNRIADRITTFAGSMAFVYIHIIWFGCWIGFGVEKYPYGLLTMIVSLEAIFLSTFVMISQNRADAKRQVIADQQWQTVQEEDRQNVQLLDLSKQILDLTTAVHAYAAARSDAVAPKTDA